MKQGDKFSKVDDSITELWTIVSLSKKIATIKAESCYGSCVVKRSIRNISKQLSEKRLIHL